MNCSTALAELLELGFDVDLCQAALDQACGDRDTAVELLLSGGCVAGVGSETITRLELSQYTLSDRSSSACTSIAWNFVASALDDIKNGKSFETVGRLTDILLEGVNLFETVSAVSGGGHLSVEEFVHLLPMPSRCQLQDHPIQHMLSETAVRDYLTDVLRGRSAPVGIVLTKPPETVAIVAHNGKYYFFDSHSRPQFGIEGAYLVSCDSIEGVVRRILLVFPPMESCGDLMLDMTYNSFEGSLFQDATLI